MRRWGRWTLVAAALAWLGTAYWQTHKPLPPGMHVVSPLCTVPVAQLAFLTDLTAADAYGHALVSQSIFDAVLETIAHARRFVVLDYELIGAAPAEAAPQRHVAGELTDALLARMRADPGLHVLVITDPRNGRYGRAARPELALLRAAGAAVVTARLDRLRDPNFLYSSLWRLTVRWWGGPPGEAGVVLRELNYKSDHRKVVIADIEGEGYRAVVGSANPLDAQSAWSNAALSLEGAAARTLLLSELAVARFSGWNGDERALALAPNGPSGCDAATPSTPSAQSAQVQVLTDGAIRRELTEQIEAALPGESIDVAAFRLADRTLIETLLEAARRGVHVRLLLDPSEDATTAAPSGLPNQPVASELAARSEGAVQVRWYRTHGERFHSAVVMVYGRERLWLLCGSANLTRRGLDDYNLEADAAAVLAVDAPPAQQALAYFDSLWSNRAAAGIEYTADFAAFADPSQVHYWLCRLLEGAGIVAF